MFHFALGIIAPQSNHATADFRSRRREEADVALSSPSHIDNIEPQAQNIDMDIPPQSAMTQKDADHIKVLAIFHLIFAVLCILGIAFLLLHYSVMHYFFANPDIWKKQNNPPPKEFFELFHYFVWFYMAFGVLLLIGSGLNLISAACLHKRKGRTFSLVIAGLNCLQIPFGTALRVFTFIVLMRDSVRLSYRS